MTRSGIRYSNIEPLQLSSVGAPPVEVSIRPSANQCSWLDLALGDHHIAREASLRRQQIVEAVVETLVADVVADREQVAGLVEQEREVHVGEFLALTRQLLQRLDPVGGTLRGIDDRTTAIGSANPHRVCSATFFSNSSIDGSIDCCKAATSRKLGARLQAGQKRAKLVESLELLRRRRERHPGRDVKKVVAMVGARTFEGAGPPPQFLVRTCFGSNLRRCSHEPLQERRRSAQRVRSSLQVFYESLESCAAPQR